METINFTCKEVLSALLNKTKTQTIRKAWTYNKGSAIYPARAYTGEKPAKFKVGDEAQLVWNNASPQKRFKNYSGEPVYVIDLKVYDSTNSFNKDLGFVKITEVFKIKMGFMLHENKVKQIPFIDAQEAGFDNSKISKLDGFKSVADMFEYFNNNYDLSTPKEFWVYRWEWLK